MPDAATALQILQGATDAPPNAGPASSGTFAVPDNYTRFPSREAALAAGQAIDRGAPIAANNDLVSDEKGWAWVPKGGFGASSEPPADAAPADPLAQKLDILRQGAQGKLPAPGPEEPPATAKGVVSNIGAGANDVIADVVGAPVDAMTWLLNRIPGIDIKSPVGGSDSIKSAFGLVGADPRNIPVENSADRLARGTGAGVASMVLPFGAARAVGEGVPLLSTFGHGTLTGNTVTGAAAGLGGSAAEEAAPEPYKPLANFGGQLAAGGLAGGLLAGGSALTNAAVNYGRDLLAPFTEAGRERLAGQRILNSASNPGALPGALDVPNPQIVPGSAPTAYQLTGDQGIGNLERAISAKNPEPFLARRAEQNAARVGAIEGLAPEGSHSGAVSDLLKQQLADLDANTQSLVDAARQRGSQAVSNLRGGMNETQYGRAMRDELAAAKIKAKEREDALWGAIDPRGTLRLDASPVREAAQEIESSIPQTAKPMGAEEKAIFGHAKMAGTAQSFRDVAALRGRLLTAIREERVNNGETPALRRMQQLREAIDQAIATAADRQAQAEEQAVAAGRLSPEQTLEANLHRAISFWDVGRNATESAAGGNVSAASRGAPRGGTRPTTGMAGAEIPSRGGSGPSARGAGVPGEAPVANFDEGASIRYRAAANATRERSQAFGTGPVGDVLRRGRGGLPYNTADSQVAARFFNGGAKSFEDANAFLRAAGGRPEAVRLLQDYAASSLREAAENPDGTLNVAKYQRWMDDHAGALRLFPELAERFQSVADAQRSIEAAESIRKAALDTFQNGVARHFLGDVEPADAVAAALRRPDRNSALAKLAQLTSGNPDARAGLQKAVVEHIRKNFIGNTEAGDTRLGTIKSDALQTFFRKNRAALSWVFPQEQMDAIEAIAADLQRANRSVAGSKLPGGSNTAQDLAAQAKHQIEKGHGGSLLSYLVAVAAEHGTDNLFAGAAAFIGSKVLGAMRSAGLHTVDDLVTQAMLDPAMARALLMKVGPNGKPNSMTLQTLYNRLLAIGAAGGFRPAVSPANRSGGE